MVRDCHEVCLCKCVCSGVTALTAALSAYREYKERRASLLMTKYGRKWARRCKRARLVEEKRLGQYAVTMQVTQLLGLHSVV